MQATTVLVEGEIDRMAVETLAVRLGHDLAAERVTVVPRGGATSIVRFLDRYGPDGAGHRLLGLCDVRESPGIARALGRAGLGSGPLAELGFLVCDADLEDELIRCLGVDAVLGVIAAQGELASFRILQHQPSQRDRPITAQLRRFFGDAAVTRSGTRPCSSTHCQPGMHRRRSRASLPHSDVVGAQSPPRTQTGQKCPPDQPPSHAFPRHFAAPPNGAL